MSGNTNSDINTPLIEAVGDDRGEEETKGGWGKRVLDVEEAKKQMLFSLPMILTNVFYYSITLVSVMYAGHLGELELAGATLANSWAVVTGIAFMVTPSILWMYVHPDLLLNFLIFSSSIQSLKLLC